MTGPGRLQGLTVAVTADRRRDEQAVLLERLGLEVLLFPLLRTEAEDSASLQALTRQLCRQPPDYFVANTGYGMRTWLQLAGQWGLQEPLVQVLSTRSTIAARGAKALGELRKVGLDAWYKAPGETLEEVVARLGQEDLEGASVVVQLHGEPPSTLLARLQQAGAQVTYLPVYRMTGSGAQAASDLISTVLSHGTDAVTFTAAPQVDALAGAATRRASRSPCWKPSTTGAWWRHVSGRCAQKRLVPPGLGSLWCPNTLVWARWPTRWPGTWLNTVFRLTALG